MIKTNTKNTAGVGAVVVVGSLLVVAAIIAISFAVWHKNTKVTKQDATAKTQMKAAQPTTAPTTKVTASDPAEGGKYLYIKEWGVRAMLPAALSGKVTYDQVTTATDPDSGLPLQAVHIFVAKAAFDGTASDCAVVSTSLGDSITSGGQYIRSDTVQSFNASRYKGTMKANILTSGKYAFHLNYIVPDCLGGANADLDTQLLNSLADLKPAN